MSVRLFLLLWPLVVIRISPLPDPPYLQFPYFDQPALQQGWQGVLLGPWQRFDTLHYTRIAAQGYAFESESVFPPLYPLLIRFFGSLGGGTHVAHLSAGILIANIAGWGTAVLFTHLAMRILGAENGRRALIFFLLFPSGFFLFAPYSESLFLLFALGTILAAEEKQWPLAGFLGLLAALTRLTGWVLLVPLAYLYWEQFLGRGKWKIAPLVRDRRTILTAVVPVLPLLGAAAFLLYRYAVGLPPISQIYAEYWYQTTGFPGRDLWRALPALVQAGHGRSREFTLWLDYLAALLLLITIGWSYFHLPRHWTLYAAAMLFFILLPTSDFKPLYSFTRYTLAGFPTFLMLGTLAADPRANRLLFYPFVALFLYLSGQFFIWGWVA